MGVVETISAHGWPEHARADVHSPSTVRISIAGVKIISDVCSVVVAMEERRIVHPAVNAEQLLSAKKESSACSSRAPGSLAF